MVIDDVLNILEDKPTIQPKVALASSSTSSTVHPWIKINLQGVNPSEVMMNDNINPTDYDMYSFKNETIINSLLIKMMGYI